MNCASAIPTLTVTAGAFRLRLGRLQGSGDAGGYVIYDARSATPWHVLVIALAGPAANLLAAAAIAALAVRTEGMLSVVLFLWMLASLLTAVTNLQPSGDPGNPLGWSDGRWAQAAWAAGRAPLPRNTAHHDANAATSIAPPPSRTATDQPSLDAAAHRA